MLVCTTWVVRCRHASRREFVPDIEWIGCLLRQPFLGSSLSRSLGYLR